MEDARLDAARRPALISAISCRVPAWRDRTHRALLDFSRAARAPPSRGKSRPGRDSGGGPIRGGCRTRWAKGRAYRLRVPSWSPGTARWRARGCAAARGLDVTAIFVTSLRTRTPSPGAPRTRPRKTRRDHQYNNLLRRDMKAFSMAPARRVATIFANATEPQ
jgi:hypothetical protein